MLHICDEYKKRRDIMIAACEASLPRDVVSWKAPKAGFFVGRSVALPPSSPDRVFSSAPSTSLRARGYD